MRRSGDPSEPGPGQESVWNYPRPPWLERSEALVVVEHAGQVIAETRSAFRILETAHPPTFYIPPEDVRRDLLVPSTRRSVCEFKGTASYWTLQVGDEVATDAAWSYPAPVERYRELKGYFAFYPSRVDACYVDGERVRAQDGDFYGGWITSKVVGPFKGGAGTRGW